MAISLLSPPASFVKFTDQPEEHCIFGILDIPYPVIYADDVAFQILLQGDTEAETQALAGQALRFGIVRDCDDPAFLIEFTQAPERSLVKSTQVLYNWGWGFPGFTSAIADGECFRVRIQLGSQIWCSTSRFQRQTDICFTSVIEYSSNEGNAFGFFACGTDIEVPGAPVVDCRPTVIEFSNVPTLTIPYTAELRDKYGDLPSVTVMGYGTDGNLVNMNVEVKLIGYPVTSIVADFGGNLSGVLRIK